MRKRTVTVNDKFQRAYRYTLSAPASRSFDPEFEPALTPAQMRPQRQALLHWAYDSRRI